MRPPLRIAILECDIPLDATRARYGGYGGVFTALMEAGADALNQPDFLSSKKGLELTVWNVVEQEQFPNLDDIDAILMSGSSTCFDFHKTFFGHSRKPVTPVDHFHFCVGRPHAV